MFGTFVKYQFQRTYDAILAAPVDTEELVTAEALWIATRAGVYGCVPLIVAMFFGLDPSWGMLAVPFIAWIAGFGWAGFGILVAGFAKSFENFNYVVSAVLTPLFLRRRHVLPARRVARVGPGARRSSIRCTSRVQLVRDAVFGFELGRISRAGHARRVRADHVADRNPRDDAEADRLSEIRIEPWAAATSRCSSGSRATLR